MRCAGVTWPPTRWSGHHQERSHQIVPLLFDAPGPPSCQQRGTLPLVTGGSSGFAPASRREAPLVDAPSTPDGGSDQRKSVTVGPTPRPAIPAQDGSGRSLRQPTLHHQRGRWMAVTHSLRGPAPRCRARSQGRAQGSHRDGSDAGAAVERPAPMTRYQCDKRAPRSEQEAGGVRPKQTSRPTRSPTRCGLLLKSRPPRVYHMRSEMGGDPVDQETSTRQQGFRKVKRRAGTLRGVLLAGDGDGRCPPRGLSRQPPSPPRWRGRGAFHDRADVPRPGVRGRSRSGGPGFPPRVRCPDAELYRRRRPADEVGGEWADLSGVRARPGRERWIGLSNGWCRLAS